MAISDPPAPPTASVGSKPSATTARTLSGSLGVGAIIFMVVAAAAPLTVVAGSVPIGILAGNGPGYPASPPTSSTSAATDDDGSENSAARYSAHPTSDDIDTAA